MDVKKTTAGAAIGTAMIMGGVDASVLNETPLERVEIVAGEEVVAVQIENTVETTFPWKDQPGFVVSYDLGEPDVLDRIVDKRNKEIITEVVSDFDGGFKVDVLLNERPNTNVFCYAIEGHENYDFFYQPPLTEQEKADGFIRPPEIEGSYAVYHKTLANNEYKTGKVMHIPRPQVWEMNNEAQKVWADMTFDNGQLCVTVPQDFLDTATYPVRVDPTFGYTSLGLSADPTQDFWKGNSYIADSNGSLLSATVGYYSSVSTNNLVVALYSSATPATVLAYTVADNTDNGASGCFPFFQDLAIADNHALVNGEQYRVVAIHDQSANNGCVAFDSSSVITTSAAQNAALYPPTSPLTFSQGVFANRSWSIYFTFQSTTSVQTVTQTIKEPFQTTVSGLITNDGGATITEHGFAYGTLSTLSGGDTATTTLGIGATGTFSQTLTGLIPNTTYFFRAYATNATGTTTGTIESFTTPSTPRWRINNGTIRINNGRLDI